MISIFAHARKGGKGGQPTMPRKKRYNTPHRGHVVKTRMTDEEYADFTERLAAFDISQAEFIRQSITKTTIRPIVTVSPVNDELLAAIGKLIAEYGKIGGNLNQIARYLNEYGAPYNTLAPEVRAAVSDLAALKFEVLRKVGNLRTVYIGFIGGAYGVFQTLIGNLRTLKNPLKIRLSI
jgi:hypothetical protein